MVDGPRSGADTPSRDGLRDVDARGMEDTVQGTLFPESAVAGSDGALPDELVGYRGPAACQIAGIT